jgi:hypothetical protein
VARRTGTSDYRLKTRVTATDTTIYLARTVNGAETILTTQPVAGLVLAGGDVLYVRLLVSGTNPTTLSAKVWRGGATEPTAWMTTTTDSTASLQAAGGVGFYSYLSASATNAPITQSVLDLTVTRP